LDLQAQKAIETAMARVYPALVRIHVVTLYPDSGRLQKFPAAGSGVIISKDGYIITNHHVAGKAKRLICRLTDGEEIEAILVGTDPLADISVLKLKLEERKNKDKPFQPAVFGDSDKVRVGDTVFAMGSPVAVSQSVTKGIVSNTALIFPELFWPFEFELDGEKVGTLVRWIGHDAAIYGGNSGGPLVNPQGEVIGINEVALGLGGAIPGNLVKSVAEQIIKTGEVKRSWTGLECQPRLKNSPVPKGVLIGGVIEGSPAAKAGFKPGDVITEFDGVPVDCGIPEDLPLFNCLAMSVPIGKTVKASAIRGKDTLDLSLTTESSERARGEDEELKPWGITARDFTRMSALELKRPDKNGVLVHSLRPGGPCEEAKPPLRPKDVIVEANRKPVRSLAELRSLTEEFTGDRKEPVPVLVGFERDDQKLLTVVRVGKEPPKEEPRVARNAWLATATQVLTEDLANALGLKGRKGVRLIQIYPGHQAEKAGLKVGDILLKLDGEEIDASHPEDHEALPNMIRQFKAGTEVSFEVVRDGKPLTVPVTLEAPPTPAAELKRYKDDNFELTVRELSFDDRVSQQIEKDLRGVFVERVEHAGWAALGHLALEDVLLSVDGQPTPDVAAVEKLLKDAETRKAKRVVFFVRRGIHNMYLEVEPSWEEQAKKK
jgi:serine protease Do